MRLGKRPTTTGTISTVSLLPERSTNDAFSGTSSPSFIRSAAYSVVSPLLASPEYLPSGIASSSAGRSVSLHSLPSEE